MKTRVLKEGKKIQRPFIQITCPKCDCVFEVEFDSEQEMKDVMGMAMDCPNCSKLCTIE